MRRRVVVVGGGYAGLSVARRLKRCDVTVVSPHSYMTYQPLLPETAAGSVLANHVVVPLRSALSHADVLTAALTDVDVSAKVALAVAADGSEHRLEYDDLVLAVGSVARTFPVPGLAEHAVGFRTVEEALHLGSRVLSRLELAATTSDSSARARALTFVFVGGGYSGVEALAEMEDMVRRVAPRYRIDAAETRWILVDSGPRILGQLPARLADYAARSLSSRGVSLLTGTSLTALAPGVAMLSDGSRIETDTVVWTAGVVGNPLLRRLGLPVDQAGRVITDPTLRVAEGIWAVGDCAAVPNLVVGGTCAPTAQHALRQAARLAANLKGVPAPYRHREVGAVASLGLRQGVAELYGVPLRGRAAWLVHRIYHGSRMPCPRRRLLVNLLWLLAPRDPVALPSIESPRAPLREAHAASSGVGRA